MTGLCTAFYNKYIKDEAPPELAPLPVPPVVRWVYMRSDLLGGIYHATLCTNRQRTDRVPHRTRQQQRNDIPLEVVSVEYGLPEMA